MLRCVRRGEEALECDLEKSPGGEGQGKKVKGSSFHKVHDLLMRNRSVLAGKGEGRKNLAW